MRSSILNPVQHGKNNYQSEITQRLILQVLFPSCLLALVAKITPLGEDIQTNNTYYEVILSNDEANHASSY